MKIAIVGFDTEGRSSLEYFSQLGHDITICDQNPELQVPKGVDSVLGEKYLDDLDRFDLIVRTAGLHPQKILENNPNVSTKLTTQVNTFFHACPTKNIIGVTGTKGKGTTSTLITKMLETSGKDVYLGGNIGVPPLSFIDKLNEDSWVVLELSSFQLIDLQYAPHIGVCLMVVPEHLNWHENMEEYVAAKSRMFSLQTDKDIAIHFADNQLSTTIASSGSGRLLPYYADPGAHVADGVITIDSQDICKTSELKLLGAHNWQNVCAAITAVWQITQDVNAMHEVLTSFSGLEHRLEFVRELNNIKYYDDSFGTTPETAAVAIQSFAEPKVVILGGSDKGAEFDVLAQTVKDNNVRQAVVIGDTGPKIIAALQKAGYNNISLGGKTMASMLETCNAHAQPGDVVLLSTGCASFGLFKDYKDRGNQFKQVVQELV
ncbi:UDP-N-acetylmuramoyl-L-alanine--D-glutamate ligase [soil metagenome]